MNLLGKWPSTAVMGALGMAVLVAGCATGGREAAGLPSGECPPSAGEISIPARLAGGTLAGSPFSLTRAEFRNGKLSLIQDSENVVYVNVFSGNGSLPVGKTFLVTEKYTSPGVEPALFVKKSPTGDEGVGERNTPENYTLKVVFEDKQDDMLSGRIFACIPDKEQPTLISGTFGADVGGFVMVDGKADLTTDDPKNFEYLAENHLRSMFAKRELSDIRFSNLYFHPTAERKSGAIEVSYRLDGKESDLKRFHFAKDKHDNVWRIEEVYDKNQIPEAHPATNPLEDPDAPDWDVFMYMGARRLEEELQKEHPDKALHDLWSHPEFSGSAWAIARFSYRLENETEPVMRAFLYHKEGKSEMDPLNNNYGLTIPEGTWVFVRELDDDERVSLTTGEAI